MRLSDVWYQATRKPTAAAGASKTKLPAGHRHPIAYHADHHDQPRCRTGKPL